MTRGSAAMLSVSRDSRIFWYSLLAAILIEALTLTIVGAGSHWLAHPQNHHGLDDAAFIEAQMVTLPEEPHLIEEKPLLRGTVKAEAVLSKVAGQGRSAKPPEEKLPESNETKSAAANANDPSLGPTHGPVALYNPMPTLPTYLQSENLNKTVVIEFLINAQAVVTPRLMRSSGNEELDAIALNTAKLWHFRPAEQNHKAIDAKVRLKIIFEVK